MRPIGLPRVQFRALRRKALQYHVEDGKLYRRAGKNIPRRTVIDSEEERKKILESLYNEHGHKGMEGTYRNAADRYYWDTCYGDTKAFVTSCEKCQKRDYRRLEEPLYPT
jgi:hypothetical protein